jgi:hypothetical protein
MADDVGYGKPPRQSRFKAGISGNPKGRPKRKPLPAADIIDHVLSTLAEYRERGQTKVVTRLELSLKALLTRAINGDTAAAESLLEVRSHAERTSSRFRRYAAPAPRSVAKAAYCTSCDIGERADDGKLGTPTSSLGCRRSHRTAQRET